VSLTPAAQAPELPVHTIAPAIGWVPIRLGEIWEFRELLFFLVWREVKIRYKQTALGVAWAILQPVLTMIVFSVFFGRLGRIPSDGLPYPVFAFSALVPWQLFAFALAESSNSVVANQRLVTKVYFPRLIMPMAAVCVGLVDFCLSLIVLMSLMAYYGVPPSGAMWTLPLWTLLAVVTALAVGLWLSALNVRYRDIRYTLPFLTQIWLVATPVAYPSSMVPAAWRSLYALNPMVGVVDGFRWALMDGAPAPTLTVGVSCLAVALLLIGGLFYFKRTERTFADVI
jgi:homopolymeric O-antigen transport system permease protein